MTNIETDQLAIRDPVDVRYDVIYAEFLRVMAKIGAVGAEKYGDFNWHKSRLTGANGPINHIHKHLVSYELREKYDHKEIGEDYKIHLAAIAFNAMMEYWYCENLVEPTKMNNFDSYKTITTPF